MTWVKICGMTNLEDALVAVDAGADAVGFVFYEKSPRFVTVETAREICSKLPETLEKIGVFVDDYANPIEAFADARLTGTQVYFTGKDFGGSSKGPKAMGSAAVPSRTRLMFAIPMNLFSQPSSEIGSVFDQLAQSKKKLPAGTQPPAGIFDTFVLDSGNIQQPGGTGKPFDWKTARPIADNMRRHGMKLVVAGGLRPENVGAAIEILQPWGVDVVSGVEIRPGKKDPEKVRAFVQAVREADRRVG